jgi:hypothetical protein
MSSTASFYRFEEDPYHFYYVLGLTPTATDEEIEESYERERELWNRWGDEDFNVKRRLRLIDHAHAVLGHPATRAKYDESFSNGQDALGRFRNEFSDWELRKTRATPEVTTPPRVNNPAWHFGILIFGTGFAAVCYLLPALTVWWILSLFMPAWFTTLSFLGILGCVGWFIWEVVIQDTRQWWRNWKSYRRRQHV